MKQLKPKLKDDLACGVGKTSWYIQKPLEKCKGLFENEKNDFIVHAFSCKCGECQIYINTQKSMTHTCQKCACGYFYTPDYFINTTYTILVNVELNPFLEKTSDGYYASIYLGIPTDVDINRIKLVYKKKKIMTIFMSNNGIKTISSKYKLISFAQEQIEKIFTYYIYKDIKKNIKNHSILSFTKMTVEEQYEILSFFLCNSHFRDAEFYFWEKNSCKELLLFYKDTKTPMEALKTICNRQEKSVLRSLFHRYNDEIKLQNFDPLFPFLICKIFDDVNIVTKLLNDISLSLYHTRNSFSEGYKIDKIVALFEFLKQYYNKFELVYFIQESALYIDLFEDIYNMFDSNNPSFAGYFVKVKISISNIHDEFIKINHIHHVSSSYYFTYTNKYIGACTLENNLEYRLPYTGKELSDWSIKLKNCLFSYAIKIAKKECIIYGVYKNNILHYAIELSEEKINQALGYSNRKINQFDYSNISIWFYNNFKNNIK